MTKARTLADFISDGSEFADGTISVAEVSGAAPLASPTFTGTVTVPNITTTGDISFGANDKAIFNNILEVYHSGSHSYISENSTGDLYIQGTNIGLRKGDGTQTYLYANAGGSVDIKYNNATKLQTTASGAAITGKTTTDELDLNAIAATISDTAVDIFVYDTRKDSDGGAWRKRTQHTSWYNETLSTSTRGSRKEFPSVAVIVAESNQVTIYDGDDPDLPMWMVFNYGTSGSLSTMNMLYAQGATVTALNGVICTAGDQSWKDGLVEIKFVSDTSFWRNASNVAYWGLDIASRNVNGGYGNFVTNETEKEIVNATVNDVAMTVLPNAPIDAATGLPVPTIAVATDGGWSQISDDGNVYDFVFSTNPKVTNIAFKNDTIIQWSGDSNLFTYDRGYFEAPLLTSDLTAQSVTTFNGSASYEYGLTTTTRYPNPIAGSTDTTNFSIPNAFGNINGLSLYDGLFENKVTSSGSNGMVAYVASDYATGWQNGAIKLATLSDTDDTNVTGSELVTNGTFDSDVSGWTAGDGATVTHQSGRMRVDGNVGTANQAITTVVGKSYTVSADLFLGTSASAAIYISNTTSSAQAFTSFSYPANSVTFIATSTTTYIVVRVNAASNTYIEVDNISVRLAEKDRSVNGNGLQVFGTVTKSAVATGADLVAYSGWSGSNYLRQPYNPDLNFGTGEWSVHCWFKIASGVNTAVMLSWRNSGGAAPYWQIYQTNTSMSFDASDGVINAGLSTSTTFRDDQWHKLTFLARGPSLREAYVDGKFIGSSTTTVGTGFTGGSDHEFKVGQHYDGAYPYTGSVALVRISATAPSPEQIKKIYEDEKFLFQENAQATLYGSSDAVTALAYDDTTELLHVGTSAGRSVFQGLRRVDNTTTAVGAAISASNGLVADE